MTRPPDARMLISIHIPKTAGTAFGQLLRDAYGDRLLLDYGDRPLAHPAPVRLWQAWARSLRAPRSLAGFEAVHGHFMALKYARVEAPVVTWLRHPAQRVVSRYEHYRRDVAAGRPLPSVSGLRPGLDLDAFSRIPRFRNTCAKYLRGFPRQRVTCFGFSEDMAEGLSRMRRTLGIELGPALQSNANPEKTAAHYPLDATTERRLVRLNAEDYRLWSWAREREGV